MEPNDLSELSRRIEAAQSRLAATVTELKHETKPAVIAGRATDKARTRIEALIFDEAGAVRLEAIVAGVVAASALAAALLLRRRR